MGIVISNNLVLSPAFIAAAGNPIFGWHNIVTVGNVTADTEDTARPAINLANSSTSNTLNWQGTNQTEQYVTVVTNFVDPIDYAGVVGHNFGSAAIAVSVDGAVGLDTSQKALLHFDGADGSTTIIDSNAGGSAHTWTANGNAQIDTAQSKFGGGSLLLDGVGDYVTTPDHADFNPGTSDFAIEGFFRIGAGSDGATMIFAGQADASFADRSFYIQRTAGNILSAQVTFAGGSTLLLNGATTVNVASHGSAFHHIALRRSGTTFSLELSGALQASGTSALAMADSASPLSIGRPGAFNGQFWNGWVDEFRFSVGNSHYGPAPFTPPPQAFDQWGWVELVQPSIPATDAPLMFRYLPQSLAALRLRLQSGSAPPRAAVLYVGKLLVAERSIELEPDHTPINLGRKTDMIDGLSQSGQYLGSIVLRQTTATKMEFANFNAAWYRANFETFLQNVQGAPGKPRKPFFVAWDPETYPNDVGYCWLTEDPQPGVSPITGRYAITLSMTGVVK